MLVSVVPLSVVRVRVRSLGRKIASRVSLLEPTAFCRLTDDRRRSFMGRKIMCVTIATVHFGGVLVKSILPWQLSLARCPHGAVCLSLRTNFSHNKSYITRR